jgi:ATP-dependent Clp protease ATP-binding subunit ClpA
VAASFVEATPIYPAADHPGFGEPVKEALEQALQAAVRRGDRRIGTEHLLLGLLDPAAVSVRRVLAALGVEPARLAALVQVEMAAGR